MWILKQPTAVCLVFQTYPCIKQRKKQNIRMKHFVFYINELGN